MQSLIAGGDQRVDWDQRVHNIFNFLAFTPMLAIYKKDSLSLLYKKHSLKNECILALNTSSKFDTWKQLVQPILEAKGFWMHFAAFFLHDNVSFTPHVKDINLIDCSVVRVEQRQTLKEILIEISVMVSFKNLFEI